LKSHIGTQGLISKPKVESERKMCCAWITAKFQQPFLYWGNVAEKNNSNFKMK
jgi:hypothetical protein